MSPKVNRRRSNDYSCSEGTATTASMSMSSASMSKSSPRLSQKPKQRNQLKESSAALAKEIEKQRLLQEKLKEGLMETSSKASNSSSNSSSSTNNKKSPTPKQRQKQSSQDTSSSSDIPQAQKELLKREAKRLGVSDWRELQKTLSALSAHGDSSRDLNEPSSPIVVDKAKERRIRRSKSSSGTSGRRSSSRKKDRSSDNSDNNNDGSRRRHKKGHKSSSSKLRKSTGNILAAASAMDHHHSDEFTAQGNMSFLAPTEPSSLQRAALSLRPPKDTTTLASLTSPTAFSVSTTNPASSTISSTDAIGNSPSEDLTNRNGSANNSSSALPDLRREMRGMRAQWENNNAHKMKSPQPPPIQIQVGLPSLHKSPQLQRTKKRSTTSLKRLHNIGKVPPLEDVLSTNNKANQQWPRTPMDAMTNTTDSLSTQTPE